MINLSEIITSNKKQKYNFFKSNDDNISRNISSINEKKNNNNQNNILEKVKFKIDNIEKNEESKSPIINEDIKSIYENKNEENVEEGDNDEIKDKIEIDFNNYKYISKCFNDKLVFDNGYIYYLGNDKYHNYNLLNTYAKQYNFVYNIEMSYFINRNYFS